MNQFKSIFLGTVDPSSDFGKLKRAANSQKVLKLCRGTEIPKWRAIADLDN
jgi:alanyl-tRNA synthetase